MTRHQAVRNPRRVSATQTWAVDGITVHVTRKPIRNMYLRVKPPDGRVEISAPLRMERGRIEGFIHLRSTWIGKAQERIVHAVRVDMTRNGEPMKPGDELGSGLDHWSEPRKAQARATINSRLPTLLEQWVPIIGDRPTSITLRVMSSRWGSCTPDTGRIRLNLELAWLDPRFLEYVLVHEMTHLRSHGHGREFQRRMDGFLHDWRETRAQLNRHIVM